MLPILASNLCRPIVLPSPTKLEKLQIASKKTNITGKLQCGEPRLSRRQVGLCASSALLTYGLGSNFSMCPARAEDKPEEEQEKEEGIIGTIKSLFESDEKTKSGAVLPKAYLKSAREVVKNLRESLKEDPKDIAKFRRSADAAKESIRDYLGSWRGQQKVAAQESYLVLEKAIKSLASFYSKAGPSAPLPEEVKSEILRHLDTAEEFL